MLHVKLISFLSRNFQVGFQMFQCCVIRFSLIPQQVEHNHFSFIVEVLVKHFSKVRVCMKIISHMIGLLADFSMDGQLSRMYQSHIFYLWPVTPSTIFSNTEKKEFSQPMIKDKYNPNIIKHSIHGERTHTF